MDSTLKSDLTVGPPIDFTVYRKDEYKIASQKCLNVNATEYSKVCNQWSEGIFKIYYNQCTAKNPLNNLTFNNI